MYVNNFFYDSLDKRYWEETSMAVVRSMCDSNNQRIAAYERALAKIKDKLGQDEAIRRVLNNED